MQIKTENTAMNSQYGGHSNPYQNNGTSEILPGLSHPIKINPSSPQNMATSPVNTAMVTDSCVINNQQLANMHSPSGYVAGGNSPQHQTTYVHANSPQNAGSPLMNAASPQMTQGNFQVTQMNSMNQGQTTNTSQASFPVTEMSGVNQTSSVLTQPVQVEEVSSLEMDADLVQTLIEELNQSTRFVQEVDQSNFNFGGNMNPMNNEYMNFSNPFNSYINNSQSYFFQARGSNACALQSREATGGMHEQVSDNVLGFDFIDGKGPPVTVGFDEVDSCRIDKFMVKEPEEVSSVVDKVCDDHAYAKTVQVEPYLNTEREISRGKEESKILTHKEISHDEIPVTETEGQKVTAVTQETQYEETSRRSTAVQVDMKPLNYTGNG